MPRNPHKSRCQAPGCSAWALRGHLHCRSHRDARLGPRGAGAPLGNLNAVKTAADAHPLAPPDLHQLAHDLVHRPDHLPTRLDRALRSIYGRTADPFRALATLQALLTDLVPLVAGYALTAELEAFLASLSPASRTRVAHAVLKHTLARSPEQRLLFLRTLSARLTIVSEKKRSRENN